MPHLVSIWLFIHKLSSGNQTHGRTDDTHFYSPLRRSVGGQKACLERQKSYSPDTICYGRTDQFDLEVKGHQQWYATHRLEVVYMPNMQSLSWTTKKLQPGHDLLRTHRWTDRLITIGHPPQSDGALINNIELLLTTDFNSQTWFTVFSPIEFGFICWSLAWNLLNSILKFQNNNKFNLWKM